MKKQFFFIGAFIFVTGFLSSCSESKSDAELSKETTVLEVADDPETEKANQIALEELKRQQDEERKTITSLSLDKMEHNFGKVKIGSENHCTFIVTNTGDKSLIVKDVKASCGCTTPIKPEKPIPPGKSDKIEVGFKPNNTGEAEKTVTITANTEPQVTIIKIKADVY